MRALPWRLGLELAGVLAGGHRILDRIDAAGGDVFRHRPRLSATDWARVACDALVPPRRHRSASMSGARMTPDEYCQQKAAQSGSSFYYSFMFLPPPRRRAITALYAFCREVDDVVDEATDAAVAQRQARVVARRDRRRVRRHAAASGGARAAAGRRGLSRCRKRTSRR